MDKAASTKRWHIKRFWYIDKNEDPRLRQEFDRYSEARAAFNDIHADPSDSVLLCRGDGTVLDCKPWSSGDEVHR